MGPVLICAEYPKESYGVGERFSLPLFVVNDLSCGLGEVSWGWELLLGGYSVAQGGGEAEVPKDSVVRIGEAKATPPAPGPALLSLWLFSREAAVSNEYAFRVSGRRGPSAPEG
jgi:hypothetical protein